MQDAALEQRLRPIYHAFWGGNPAAYRPVLADDCVGTDRSGTPDAGDHQGADAVIAWAEETLKMFRTVDVTDLSFEDLPSGRLLVVANISGITNVGGMPIDIPVAHVLTLREGLVTRVDAFLDPDAARAFACA